MKVVYLTEVSPSWYCIENAERKEVTSARYFGTIEEAINWGKRWVSSWPDLMFLDISEVFNGKENKK